MEDRGQSPAFGNSAIIFIFFSPSHGFSDIGNILPGIRIGSWANLEQELGCTSCYLGQINQPLISSSFVCKKTISVVLKLQQASESLGGPVKTQSAELHPQVSNSRSLGWSSRICIFNKDHTLTRRRKWQPTPVLGFNSLCLKVFCLARLLFPGPRPDFFWRSFFVVFFFFFGLWLFVFLGCQLLQLEVYT